VRIVLIAAKQLALAKTRLAPALPSVAERALLAEAMFRDVLSAAVSARTADRVAVITSDPVLIAAAGSARAMIIDEQFPRGLNVAVSLATEQLMLAGAQTVCTILSDIPLITGADIDAALAARPDADRQGAAESARRGQNAVVLIPSGDFSGTNMIVRTPPDVIATQFGRLSLVRHREDCRKRAIPCEIVRLMRPALDLDLPADLIEFARTPSMTHTYGHLARLGMIHD
jgi:2-phospho-L-lactate guanylyltransferase